MTRARRSNAESTSSRLLYGERGFWVRDYLDQDDPAPGYGLFPHVQLAALTERVATLE